MNNIIDHKPIRIIKHNNNKAMSHIHFKYYEIEDKFAGLVTICWLTTT